MKHLTFFLIFFVDLPPIQQVFHWKLKCMEAEGREQFANERIKLMKEQLSLKDERIDFLQQKLKSINSKSKCLDVDSDIGKIKNVSSPRKIEIVET